MNGPSETSRQIFEYHPKLGRRFIPGIKARIPHESGGYLIRVNGMGFRNDRELNTPRGPDVRRVALFGDSFTAGDGVSNGKRFGDLLESLIPRLEVFNFGVPGTGTDEQFLAYQELRGDVDADLLVIAMNIENLRRNSSRYLEFLDDRGVLGLYPKPYFELHDGQLVLGAIPARRDPITEAEVSPEERALIDKRGRYQGLRKAVNAIGLKDIVQRLTRYQPLPEYDDPTHPSWLLTRAILEQWIRMHGGPVLVIPLPMYMYVEGNSDPSGYQARYRELAAATACTVHDPLPDLLAYTPEERRSFRHATDVHPSARGHEAFAKSIAPVVERLLTGR